jgi:hypothetical protein
MNNKLNELKKPVGSEALETVKVLSHRIRYNIAHSNPSEKKENARPTTLPTKFKSKSDNAFAP